MPRLARYYRFAGRLHRNLEFEWRPGYVTTSATGYHPPVSGSAYALRLLGARGELLLEHPIAVEFGNRPRDPDRAHLREKIPWRDDAHTIELCQNGRRIFAIERPDEPPVVEFDPTTTPLAKARGGAKVRVSWTARSPSKRPLFHYLSWSDDDGQTWEPLGTRKLKPGATLIPGQLPGGSSCRLRVRVTDGFHTVDAVSRPIRRPSPPPEATILWPDEGEDIEPGSEIEVSGQALRLHQDRRHMPSFEWRLDDKVVSTDPSFRMRVPDDEAGHELSLRVTDAKGRSTATKQALSVRKRRP